MPSESYPRGLIQRLAESEVSATAALQDFRSAGGKIRDATWYRMWGEVRNERETGGMEMGKPLHLRPSGDEILPVTTVRAKGYAQRVQVFGRNSYGDVFTKTIDVRSSTLVSRKNAINRAVGIATDISERPAQPTGSEIVQVIGAVYGGTYELNPR